MFEFTETITIQAPHTAVWELMRHIERWWPVSNPEHESLRQLDNGPLGVGTRLRIREKIAGIPGEATGTITRFDAGRAVSWEAPRARYRFLGLAFTVGEGVTWRIDARADRTTAVSAHVWATFPHGLAGRLLAAVFTRLLHGIEKDREHTRTELRYLKRALEAGRPAGG